MTNEDVLGMSVRELLQRAVKLIIKESQRGPDFDRRIDMYFDLNVNDPKIGRKHPVRVRVKLTAKSLIFDQAD